MRCSECDAFCGIPTQGFKVVVEGWLHKSHGGHTTPQASVNISINKRTVDEVLRAWRMGAEFLVVSVNPGTVIAAAKKMDKECEACKGV